jgi:hypothetical protein
LLRAAEKCGAEKFVRRWRWSAHLIARPLADIAATSMTTSRAANRDRSRSRIRRSASRQSRP